MQGHGSLHAMNNVCVFPVSFYRRCWCCGIHRRLLWFFMIHAERQRFTSKPSEPRLPFTRPPFFVIPDHLSTY